LDAESRPDGVDWDAAEHMRCVVELPDCADAEKDGGFVAALSAATTQGLRDWKSKSRFF
jgi:hypothetical protein